MKYCYDIECFNLAIYFFGEKDPRLQEIAQAIQETVEFFPNEYGPPVGEGERA